MSSEASTSNFTDSRGGKKEVASAHLKRTITIKSQVTEAFREKASGDLGEELKVIDAQLEQLEAQFQQSLSQLEEAARKGHNVAGQMNQLHQDANAKRQQLGNLKQEVSHQLQNVDKMQNGDYVVTGQLENYVEVRVGDNIYERIRGAEILVKDGVVTAILG